MKDQLTRQETLQAIGEVLKQIENDNDKHDISALLCFVMGAIEDGVTIEMNLVLAGWATKRMQDRARRN